MNTPDFSSVTEKRDAAYEIKFLLPSPLAGAVMTWARRELAPDPHAEEGGPDGYRVNSLYFDTPGLDVYQRKGSYGKAKYRVRRYGSERSIFLERKLKSRGLVSKRRTRIPDEELRRLGVEELEPEWVGYWFRRRLVARRLFPRCQIRYQRVARVGMTPSGPVRLTIDRNVCAFASGDYGIHESASWTPLLPEQCILELKFRLEMPPMFKSLLEEFSLAPQPVSKYRLSIQTCGLDPGHNNESIQHNGHVSVENVIPEPQSQLGRATLVQPEA
jgi:hypothetical protein